MASDGPHDNIAARITQQLNFDHAARGLRDNVYGATNNGARGSGLFVISGWIGFFALLGFGIGAITSHSNNVGAWEGAMFGAGAGAALGLVISLALGVVFKGISLGFTGIKMLLGLVMNMIGRGTYGLFGGLPRAGVKGAAAGAAVGAGLATWLDAPMWESIIHVAPMGGALGIGWRAVTLARAALKRGDVAK